MNTCRTCLESRAEKDISELENGVDDDNKSCLDIMLFCLDIKVAQDSKITTNLCNDCYSKIISFHKFKTQSLKNDAYLKSLEPVVKLVDQKLSGHADENEIKVENMLKYEEFDSNLVEDYDTKIKVGVELKDEDLLGNVEALSVEEQIKYEYIEEEIKENAPIRNKRGPRKKQHVLSKKDIGPIKKVTRCKNAKSEEKQQMCEECGKYVTKKNMRQHSQQHKPKDERRMLQCRACPKQFFSKGGRIKHYRVHHLGKKSKCDICNKEFVHVSVHKRMVHNKAALRFGCLLCDHRSVSQAALDVHMTKHTKVYPFECDICHKKFRRKGGVTLHIQGVHEKQKKFHCHLCPKAFFEKYGFDRHIRSHTNERPYKCDDCGKAFMDRGTLRNHMLVHRDVRPFSCKLCDMTFARPCYLNSHMITHTKEKKHQCKYCGARFGRADNRRSHERTAHEKYFVNAQDEKQYSRRRRGGVNHKAN